MRVVGLIEVQEGGIEGGIAGGGSASVWNSPFLVVGLEIGAPSGLVGGSWCLVAKIKSPFWNT